MPGTHKDADASIISESDWGVNGSWVVWCPARKLELTGTLGVEFVSLDLPSEKAEDGRHIGNHQDEVTLYSAVINAEKILYKRFSLLGEAGIRQDLIFYPQYYHELREEKITNLELLIGAKFIALKTKRINLSPYLMVGVNAPMGAEVDIEGGGVVKLGLNTLIKHRKRLSWMGDLYFRQRDQDAMQVHQSTKELTLALKVIFTP